MIRRPTLQDHKVVGKYVGKVLVGVGLLMLPAAAVSLAFREWDPALDLIIGFSACLIAGYALQVVCRTERDLNWTHGLVVASGSWIAAMTLGAIPYWLSGRFGSFLDASFDVMSGFTTTGLFLMQDLDHISYGMNTYRALLTYAGGQGIIVIALTFLFKGTAGAYKLYVGEGKEERLLPNVVNTARAIWLVSLAWLVVGSAALFAAGLFLGQRPMTAFLHGIWVFMGGFSTGGFGPTSYNMVLYHSFLYEALVIVLFTAGSLNFALHWALWRGDRAEIRRNIETVSFAATLTLFVAGATLWLARAGIYPDTLTLFRKAFYQLISGHTTTGFGTIYARSFVTQWGTVGMLFTIAAMAIGASACSTAGGIKGIRVGVITKTFFQDVRRMISAESAVVRARYHHVRDHALDAPVVRTALLITVAYLTMYAFMTILNTLFGYPLVEAAFEGVSVAANTGLSCGVTNPGMPAVMKAAFIVAMWLGRLEYMSVFAFVGYFVSMVRGR
ncbi:MAG: TrkH family potassium uptake protein [Coriobacteriia bacterium]|nr:TrkH family potassium uptake protein [Coriobacteriia bacterium]